MYIPSILLEVLVPLFIFNQILPSVAQTAGRCTSRINTRKEVRTLSQAELTSIQGTINKMHNDGWFNWFSYTHMYYADRIHGTPEFLPWHRYFLREFEKAGQFYDPNFAAPYWDSTVDSANPASSIVFTSGYWGGNGGGSGRCLTSGFQGGWQRMFPNEGCLTRNFDRGNSISPWNSPESVTSTVVSSTNYNSFRNGIEYGIHGAVHNGISGDMSTMQSPNDSIFFLHHGFIDYLWWKWQRASSNNLMSYSGTFNGRPVSNSDRITGFNVPVRDTMVLGYGQMCFSYDNQPLLNKRGTPKNRLSSKKSKVTSYRKLTLNREAELVTDSQEIEKVTQVPTMSLVSLLNSTVLDRFFPGLADGKVSPNEIHMPDAVTQKAVDYANQYLDETSNQVNTTVVPVASTSIVDSLLATADNNCIGCEDSGTNSTSQRKSKNRNLRNAARVVDAPPTPKDLTMPIPARLSDSMLKMFNIDVNEYNQYYSDQVQLVNILNQAGYVSPYIQ
ncbi:hypothetical protein BB560_007039 [Smittium megazygosporum]|uniref:Tyrosinase copper-binding domain-containing protein n=1 Tax=Smittium megazygosporum TaxID=133381 RepID=A0A2T9XZ52_9FUNG|nr:hypothetical protein BB560_007039 [Smittium megazygosporum]